MFCTQCGNEVAPHARFCSKCGTEATTPATAPAVQLKKPEHDMNMHINILGWLLIGNAILTGMAGFILLFAGQFIRHLPVPIAQEMPMGVPPFIVWVSSVLGFAILAVAAGAGAAGVGLLQYRSWARTLAIIAAVLLLIHFPIGTIIAVYAFWVLLSREGQEYYTARSESTMTASGT